MKERWNVAKSSELYGIEGWSAGYFSIDSTGDVSVHPHASQEVGVSLYSIVTQLKKQGVPLPILLRFDDILENQIRQLYNAFQSAIELYGYDGNYHLAYPIKVNQQCHVMEAIIQAGQSFSMSFEAGSKPELLALLASQSSQDGLLLCNGYKDDEYLQLALLARKFGRRTIVIIEQPYELDYILSIAEELGVEAEIGLRMKPNQRGSGRWADSGGSSAKFGLTSFEALAMIEKLRAADKLNWVKLLHFHIGSQITTIKTVKKALREGARMYAEVKKYCPELSFFDVGGGLAVDYDGSHSASDSSADYSVSEYARDVIWAINDVCKSEKIAHPDVITESGRATVTHHSVLITEVTDVTLPFTNGSELPKPPTDHQTLRDIYNISKRLNLKNCVESFHDAIEIQELIAVGFSQGTLTLEERAYAEKSLKKLLANIYELAKNLKYVPDELRALSSSMRSIYFCNFSVFKSVPDSWAIDQLFPVMPIHRLCEEPTRPAIIGDLTCDSDGKIDRFVHPRDEKRALELHEHTQKKPYYLGVFLLGAYQEILGDNHNLFGDTHAVHVVIGPSGEVEFKSIVKGDTISDVLGYVQYDTQDLRKNLRESVKSAESRGQLTAEESDSLIERYNQALTGYTYLIVETED